MPTMILRFPAGRYHATPHGHHVNEGLVEWPPSPWRLLRALLAAGYATQRWAQVPPAGTRLIEALAGTLPSYRLPPANLAHSRHFMPLGIFDKGREKTTLVFDAWANVGKGALTVRWNCPLDPDAQGLFDRLVHDLGYLGRSESWVIGETVADDAELGPGDDAIPHTESSRPGLGWEQISLLVAEIPEAYANWRAGEVSRVLRDLQPSEGQKLSAAMKKKRATAEAPYPQDILACLQCDTGWWQRHGWNQAPGSRRVLYWRRAGGLSVGTMTRPAPTRSHPVQAMLLALTTPTGNRSPLPSIARTLPQAELIHKSLVSRAANGGQVHCPELTGRDDAGEILRGHRHAHILPVDLDGDGHLDHVLIYASMGLGHTAQQAIHSLDRTWTKGLDTDLRLAVAGHGSLLDLQHLPAPLSRGIAALTGGPDGASTWCSLTPLVLPRHLKSRGSNAFEGQIQAELTSRGLPSARVEVLPWSDRTLKLRHIVRARRRPAQPPPVDVPHVLRLTFERPVQGPVSIGYASHFGLGLFGAEPLLNQW